MKRIFLTTVLLLVLVGSASAYDMYITAPDELQAGRSLIVNGTSNFPAGTSFDVVLYRSTYTANEINTRTVTLQDVPAPRPWIVAFSTKGLQGGQYKVEVRLRGTQESSLSSDSQTMKVIQIIDRSNEITISSSMTQTLSEALRIEGSIAKLGAGGVQLEVRGPSGIVFGPQYIETKNNVNTGDGSFARKVPVSESGDYDVSFSDTGGFIGTVTFTVTTPQITATATDVQATTVRTTRVTTTTPAPVPTTQSPLPVWTGLIALTVAGVSAAVIRNKNQ
jgi:hypothetical protein